MNFELAPEGTTPHAVASRIALEAYAKEIQGTDMELARRIYSWLDTLEPTSKQRQSK